MKLKALFLAMMVATMMVVTGCGDDSSATDSAPAATTAETSNSQLSDADYINMVKGGTLNLNPNVPMGAAFDQFFDGGNGVWTSFISDDADKARVVEFSGDCTWNGKPARLLVQFTVKGDAFEMNYIEVDGAQMSHEDSLASLQTILDSYKK